MANDDRAELRRLAEVARDDGNPEPWEYVPTGPSRSVDFIRAAPGQTVCDFGAYPPSLPVAKHIAAASPSVVLGLLDEIEALRATPSVLRPLSAQQIEDALNEGAAESQAARGDNSYQYLLRERDSLRADVARLEAALAEERGLLDDAIDAWASGDSYESHDVIRDRLAHRTTGTAPKEPSHDWLRAEVERLGKERDEAVRAVNNLHEHVKLSRPVIERRVAERIAAWQTTIAAEHRALARRAHDAGMYHSQAVAEGIADELAVRADDIRSMTWRTGGDQ